MKLFSLLLVVFFVCVAGMTGAAQDVPASAPEKVYLFCYFKGNGQDGLHLAYSTGGFVWKALKVDQSFLTPKAGGKLMRDPSIWYEPDGVFRMVWTSSLKDRGIGYASSKDLVHWSEPQFIPLMEREPQAENCWAPELFQGESAGGDFLIL